ncbi:DNA-binding protein [Haloglomus irregulare]|uniref:DNA-binding protein n=1 Tax=Haloglomus irregulare TaxID=2234134 RepID=A0A554NFM0_9EURY|nr:DNA-binding protein [Haloglomus irregulare]TSD16197.1 DNA-binding protein [Haloglomus irregulare]
MSTRDIFGNDVSGRTDNEQWATWAAEEGLEAEAVDEDEIYIVDERPELHATVAMETRTKVDTNHPDTRRAGLTLAAEERIEAREWEIERTRTRVDRSPESDREHRTAQVVEQESRERRVSFERRAASVDSRRDPDAPDPRERLSGEELAAVNQEARRIQVGIPEAGSTAAISRELAEQVLRTGDLLSATVAVADRLKTQPGTVTPISRLGDVPHGEVDFSGRVAVLWGPSHPAIQQVGLIEDETGRVKVTVWDASDQPWLDEGERVRIHGAAKSWYQGRVSVALTSRSRVVFPERETWQEQIS